MAVPTFFEFFEAFLNALSDGEIRSAKDVRECVAAEMHLSEADRSEMLPSGTQSKFDNRVAWARAYLDKAGLIDTPLRGKYRITKIGKEALASKAKIDLEYLNQFESFKKFHETASDKPATTGCFQNVKAQPFPVHLQVHGNECFQKTVHNTAEFPR